MTPDEQLYDGHLVAHVVDYQNARRRARIDRQMRDLARSRRWR